MLLTTLTQVSVLVLSFTTPAIAVDCLLDSTHTRKDALAEAVFTIAVNEYVELHRQVHNPMSARVLSSDPEQIQKAADALAAAIRSARPTTRRGSVFTPQVADFFRRRIAVALRDVECDVASRFDEIEEAAPWNGQPAVNGALPWGAVYATWASVVWRLPFLPEEIEYRIVGRDLVLLDVHANLVVDILENAAPMTTQDSGEGAAHDAPMPHGDPCDAHPELAVCWM